MYTVAEGSGLWQRMLGSIGDLPNPTTEIHEAGRRFYNYINALQARDFCLKVPRARLKNKV